MLTARPVLAWVGQPAPVIPDAVGYIDRLIPSVWPFFAFVVLRQTLQAHRRTAPIVLTIVVANLLNVRLNYIWIDGKLGFAPLRRRGDRRARCRARRRGGRAPLDVGGVDRRRGIHARRRCAVRLCAGTARAPLHERRGRARSRGAAAADRGRVPGVRRPTSGVD